MLRNLNILRRGIGSIFGNLLSEIAFFICRFYITHDMPMK